MTPYYADDWVTIYHGDCREILPTLAHQDLIVTDPPYGVRLDTDYTWRAAIDGGSRNTYRPVIGDDQDFDPEHLLGAASRHVLWGGNFYAERLPKPRGWLIWNKRDAGRSGLHSDAELAWTTVVGSVRCHNQFWQGAYRTGEAPTFYHPTQKPVSLMSWCIQLAGDADSVLDPYAGSGSTMVAAKALSVPSIGIELEERYCEIAARRCTQEVLDLRDETPHTLPRFQGVCADSGDQRRLRAQRGQAPP